VRALAARGVDLEAWAASADRLRARWLAPAAEPGPGEGAAEEDRLTWGSSADGRVRARVTPSGMLRDLMIDDRALAAGPAAAAAGIRQAVLAACRRSSQRVGDDLAQAPGHRIDVEALRAHLARAEEDARRAECEDARLGTGPAVQVRS